MKRLSLSTRLLAVLLLQACATSAPERLSLTQLTASVVALGNDQAAMASGFVVDGGWLLTNNHVSRTGPLYIVSADGKRTVLKLAVRDETNDIAVYTAEVTLPSLTLADTTPGVGDPVFALGNPLGLGITATQGIVSALPKSIGKTNLLQTDAAINPGNSGGPLINANGEVIGMVSSRGAVGSGIGFAVPSEVLRRVLRGLEN